MTRRRWPANKKAAKPTNAKAVVGGSGTSHVRKATANRSARLLTWVRKPPVDAIWRNHAEPGLAGPRVVPGEVPEQQGLVQSMTPFTWMPLVLN